MSNTIVIQTTKKITVKKCGTAISMPIGTPTVDPSDEITIPQKKLNLNSVLQFLHDAALPLNLSNLPNLFRPMVSQTGHR